MAATKKYTPTPNRLVLYRKRMGFSQKYVARLLGYHNTSMLSRYELGKSWPPSPVALHLGIILRVPVEFIFQDFYLPLREKTREQEERLAGRGQQALF